MAQATENTNQVRWLVVGPVTPTPSGKTFSLTRNNFMEWLESRNVSCDVDLAQNLGERGAEPATLKVEKLSALTLKGVTSAVPVLSKLLQLAGDVKDEEQAIKTVEELVGAGALTKRIAEATGLDAPKQEGSWAEADPAASVFEAAEMPKPKSMASSAIDAFVRTARSTSGTTRRSKSARKVRDVIEEAVYAAARIAFDASAVQQLESSLRGLKFFTDQCPEKSGMVVEVLDVPLADVAETLKSRERGDLVDEPDALFVPHAVQDLEQLKALGELGEELLCPVIVEVSPQLFGKDDMAGMLLALEDVEPGKAEPEWLALRQEESSRWLCCVANPVVLFDEGSGVAKRHVTGSGVWALGAAMAKSYAEVGSFARIIGRPGSINAPGAKILDEGRYEGTSAPTEIFIPIRGQTTMAKHGIVAVGSSRNSATVVFAETPMARASSDAVPLPAQLLTGRIVRFAQWVRDQLPSDADGEMARSVFQEAAKVFLFPGMTDFGEVMANIVEEDGVRELRVYAQVAPALAGIPFEIGFPLPLD